ncbi:MAG: hypothetical protein AAF529_24350 [Pseudomonadota bacterium]
MTLEVTEVVIVRKRVHRLLTYRVALQITACFVGHASGHGFGAILLLLIMQRCGLIKGSNHVLV